MKSYTITVNGTSYEVTVEEHDAAFEPTVRAQAAVSAPAPKEAPKQAAPKASGRLQVVAPMPGKILSVKIKAGDQVKRGQAVMVLEAMKMENEIVAPDDGVVASVEVAAGANVEAGALLASIN
jgi:biotin carboxyl carrier protein